MKTYYVNDLEKGMTLGGETFAVQKVELAETKSKKPFYRVTLIDKTGSISGNIWGDNFQNVEKKALKPGKVVIIDARVDEFKGNLTLNIDRVNSVNEASLDEYVEGSDFDIDELYKNLQDYISNVKDKNIKKYLNELFSDKDFALKFKTRPAAEYVHHSFRGGLIEHVVEMLDMLQPMRRFYPEVDYDLVTAGIILHDVGKLEELKVEETVVQRTDEGYLLGHIAKGYEFVSETAKGVLDDDQLLRLKHIILSHHGQLDYGSPVVPSTIEASVVSVLDSASSQVRIYQKVLRKSEKRADDFSEWDNLLKTKVYLPKRNQENDELTLI